MKKHINKNTMIENLYNYFKTKWVFYVIFILIFFAFPFILNAFFEADSKISADGYLAYYGTICTIVISLITVYQSETTARKQEEREETNRANDIRPMFKLKIIYDSEENNYDVILMNENKYPVAGIYLFDKLLFPILKCQKEYYKKIDYNILTETVNFFLPEARILNSKCPSKVFLVYENLDREIFVEHFVCEDNCEYISLGTERYM